MPVAGVQGGAGGRQQTMGVEAYVPCTTVNPFRNLLSGFLNCWTAAISDRTSSLCEARRPAKGHGRARAVRWSAPRRSAIDALRQTRKSRPTSLFPRGEPMASIVTAALIQRIAATHAQLLDATGELDEDQFIRWLAPDVPSAGWHLWHIARWADRVQAILPFMLAEGRQRPESRREVWEAESLASRWGFDPGLLGYGQTGTQMADKAASALRLPNKTALHDYARRAFAAADATIAEISDERLAMRGPDLVYAGLVDRERSGSEAVVGHLSHANRHLGTMEGIRALLLRKPGSMTF